MDGVRYEGIFTPPSLEGTLLYPGNPGGTNWGSMAYDHASRIGYLAMARLPTIVKLIPRDQYRAASRKGTLNGKSAQHTAQSGTPYGMARTELTYNGLPCLEGPWATLVAGNELWAGALPAGAHATPMGYRHGGMDYVVVTAGGDLTAGEGRGDYVVAFRLAADATSDIGENEGKAKD